MKATLWLVPTPLDFGCEVQTPLDQVLPTGTLAVAARLPHWICENAKTTRAYPLIEDTHYTQTQLGARYTLPLGQHMLTFGLGRQTDQLRIANNTSREGDRRNQYGLAQGDFTLLPDLHMLAGVRYDSFNEFGHAATPRLVVATGGLTAAGEQVVRLHPVRGVVGLGPVEGHAELGAAGAAALAVESH